MRIADIVELNARKAPARPAICFAETGDVVSWGRLGERTARLAQAIAALTEPGDRVAILAENSAEYIECYYGVPDAGAALTLLNYRLHPREWVWILNDASPKVLIADRKHVEMVLDLLPEIPSIRTVITIGEPLASTLGYEDLLRGARAERPGVPAGDRPGSLGERPAWIVYTSGTTGKPKGAMLSHRNIFTAVVQSVIHYGPSPEERFLNAMPLCHIAGYLVIVNQFRGGTVYLQAGWDPERWMQVVDEHGVTSGGSAPAMINMVLQHPKISAYKLDSLTSVGYGAAIMPVEVLRAMIDRFGPVVYAGFGMTELAGNVLTLDKTTHVRAARGEEHLLAATGSTMCMSDAQVWDDNGAECPSGEVGEIVVKGDQTTMGYLGNEEATAAAYQGGWFHTGDLARRDDEGFFTIVDRKKDMIITGGENVYSTEVENAIYAHPAVAEVAVVGLPDDRWGEAVTAVVVLRPAASATEEEIVAACRASLAGFKRPRQVYFADDLPRTVSGKVLKRELRERYRDRAPAPGRAGHDGAGAGGLRGAR
jgi:acyl-CoA synthetase (AMP-forming)/AMP-acid ligase II